VSKLDEVAQRHLPKLLDYGCPVDPTGGDVAAIFRGCVRLLRGESVESETREGHRLTVRASLVGVTVIVSRPVDGSDLVEVEPIPFTNAHDALVYAYGLISNFNIAWSDFEGLTSNGGRI
jgi:hypothetical protein